MANRPVKEYSLGKCKAAIFQGDYQGKATYSVKFQKSYNKDGKWNNTDFFSLIDLRELYGLIGCMLDKQVKERVPGQNESSSGNQEQPQTQTPAVQNQDEVPFG